MAQATKKKYDWWKYSDPVDESASPVGVNIGHVSITWKIR